MPTSASRFLCRQFDRKMVPENSHLTPIHRHVLIHPIALVSRSQGLTTERRLCQAALLVLLSAAARAGIVAAHLAPPGEVLISTRPAKPAHGQYMIAWCRRGTALSQAHGDFHIL